MITSPSVTRETARQPLVSTGLQIHRRPSVVIPAGVARVMAAIAELVETEYGIYLRGEWDASSASVLILGEDYYLPQQEVTGASIVFTEEPPGPEWNVVIHRHPAGCTTFSATDEDSVNQEFLASILYIAPWAFPRAVVNIPLVIGSKMQVPAKVVIDGSIVDVDEVLASLVRNCVIPAPSRAILKPMGGDYDGDVVGIIPRSNWSNVSLL